MLPALSTPLPVLPTLSTPLPVLQSPANLPPHQPVLTMRLWGCMGVLALSYSKERVPNELSSVQAPTMILWAEDNAFHSWRSFKPLAAKLRQRLGARGYKEYVTRREGDTAWGPAAKTRAIVHFLTGIDPLPQAQTVAARPEHASTAADGRAIIRSEGVIFRSDVTDIMVRGADTAALACAALARAHAAGELPSLLRDLAGSGGGARAAVMARFGHDLPYLDDSTITPARLEALGLWSPAARAAADGLQARAAGTPRYFRGRMVLLPSAGSGNVGGFGMLVSIDEAADNATVRIDGPTPTPCRASPGPPTPCRASTRDAAPVTRMVCVSWRALLLLNQRHVLPRTASADGGESVVRLEDGLWADFTSPLLRAEVARIALALDDVYAHDISTALTADDETALDAARAKAVITIRSCLDLTSFARDGGADRGRDRSRYAKDDVAKLAAHGEGHCRTCSSTIAPFLWAFAELLAIDPHYCTDAAHSHQWLQFDTRPSMRSYACDVYRDELAWQRGAPRGGTHIAERADGAYAAVTDIDADKWGLFPQNEPLELGGRKVGSAPVEPTDVDGCLRECL